MRRENNTRAITYSLTAGLLFACLGLLIKWTTKQVPLEMIAFFRQFFSVLIVLATVPFRQNKSELFASKQFPLILLRTFASIASMYCLYYALEHLPLVKAVLFSYTRPLFIPLVVLLWFGTRITKKSLLGLFLGFIGVALIIKPGSDMLQPASIVGLGSGLFGALAFTVVRRLTRTEPSDRILLYYLLFSLPITAIPAVAAWQPISWTSYLVLLAIGIVATIYQMLLTRAYSYAKAFKVGSLLYSSVIFALIIELIESHRAPDYVSCIGILIIGLGCILALRQG